MSEAHGRGRKPVLEGGRRGIVNPPSSPPGFLVNAAPSEASRPGRSYGTGHRLTPPAAKTKRKARGPRQDSGRRVKGPQEDSAWSHAHGAPSARGREAQGAPGVVLPSLSTPTRPHHRECHLRGQPRTQGAGGPTRRWAHRHSCRHPDADSRTDTPCAGATASGRGPASWAGWAKDRVGLGDFLTKPHTELEARQLVNVAKETGGGPRGKGDSCRHSAARSGMAQGSLLGQRQKLSPHATVSRKRGPTPIPPPPLCPAQSEQPPSPHPPHLDKNVRRWQTHVHPNLSYYRHSATGIHRRATDYWGHHSHGTQCSPTSLDSRTKPEVPDFMQRPHPEDRPWEPLLAPAGQ